MSRPLFLEVCLVTAMAVVILALGAPSVHASESDPEIHVDEIYFLDSGGNRTDYVLVGQNFTIRTHVWIEDTTTPHLMDVDVQFREDGELIGTYSMGWVQDGHDEWIEMNRTGREPAGQARHRGLAVHTVLLLGRSVDPLQKSLPVLAPDTLDPGAGDDVDPVGDNRHETSLTEAHPGQ